MGKKMVLGGAVAVLAIVGVGVWWLVFKDEGPPAVDLAAAADQLDEDLAAADEAPDEQPVEAEEESEAPNPDDGVDGGIDGMWIIDDEIGSFDFDTASGSFVGFRVDEELVVGATTAVGRSGGVSGSLRIEAGDLVAAEVTVDMTTIVSNDSRRERAIRGTLSTSQFTAATFVLTEPVALGDGVAHGDEVTVQAQGDLTIKGVTQAVSFSIGALVRDDGLGVLVGSADIVWADFGVSTPSAAIVVSVADEGIIEFQLVVAKQ